MLNRQELVTLSQCHDSTRPVVSLYLKVDRQSPEPKHVIRFKNLVQQAEERRGDFSTDTWQSITDDLERARATIRDEYARGSQSLVIFGSGEHLWKVYELPYEVPTALYLEEQPVLRPLFRLLQRFDRYLAILVDQHRARLFMVTPDGAEEVAVTEQEFPIGEHDQGGWAQGRFERHREHHVHRHYKAANDLAFEIFRHRGYNGVVLLGTEETTSALREELHPYLQKLVLASEPMSLDASASTVGRRVMEIARGARRERQRQMLDDFEAEIKSSGALAVEGLEETLRATQQGQLLTLLLQEDLKVEGGRCSQCDALTIETQGDCPYCGGTIVRLDDVVESLVSRAYQQDAEVIFLATDGGASRLKPYGGIGATLRFALT
ncbi:MAG: Vms1/Ankzf1 family peptidyl-tRNA hydrolase [Ardenticatenaceae bacterium]|nr:Vms1/Ankzf1 family peptidyl-tRNA hydrolase [Ardenticatenaceae bacterium]HBY95643.1 hypothetical protein [Chloroflexota bacterium]